MTSILDEKKFIECQIKEIRRYVQEHPGESANTLVFEWIEKNAANYRKQWGSLPSRK